MPPFQRPIRSAAALVLAVAVALAACSGEGSSNPAGASADAGSGPVTLRLGFFPNVTHATALVGVERGIFAEHLGPDVDLALSTFSAGPKAVEALFAGALDATYIGPNPAINAYVKSDGDAIRIISGATSGGAFFVVADGITGPSDLKGAKIATPQLGGTQDVALRAWLAEHGLQTDTNGGGDVSILPQENAQTLDTFKTGAIDGAWVPEPWATRLVQEGGAKVLVDERDLWPDGAYVTTHLIVRTEYLEEHPDVVERLLRGQVTANEFVNANVPEAQQLANDQIEKITQKRVADEVIQSAWQHLTFTNDPIAASLQGAADSAAAVGLLDRVDLTGIYDLTLLNEVLSASSEPGVRGL
jgi:NitT/TauT family transport system substrate-binding protein